MSERRAKAAVIGVGLIGEQHAEAYHAYPRANLTMVYDLNAERAQAVADRLGCAAASSIDDIANSDIEVVSVATPDHLHFEATMQVLEAGKHVCVEKPLATITREAQQMVDKAEEQGVEITLNLGNRWNAGFQSIRDSVQAGEVGEPVFGYSRCSDTIWVPTQMLSWAGQSGPQWFLFAHTMDLFRWFLGQEARQVYAVGTKRVLKEKGINAFDAIQAVVQFERTFVTFETSWILPEAWPAIVEFELTVNGDKGRLGFDGVQGGFELSSDIVGKHMYARPSLWNYFKLPDSWWGAPRDLVDSVLDGKKPIIDARDGVAVTAMIEATERSIAEGRPVQISEMTG
jgi:predicted dehydrogenase